MILDVYLKNKYQIRDNLPRYSQNILITHMYLIKIMDRIFVNDHFWKIQQILNIQIFSDKFEVSDGEFGINLTGYSFVDEIKAIFQTQKGRIHRD